MRIAERGVSGSRLTIDVVAPFHHVGHHGRDSGSYRSVYLFEIYNNTFDSAISQRLFHFRGGSGVAYGNVFTGSGYTNQTCFASYRSCAGFDPCGQCDGTSICDGNLESNGYPCQDQVGRVADGSDAGDAQDAEPVVMWNNSLNGDPDLGLGISATCPAVADHVKEERDWIDGQTCSDGIDNDGDGQTDMADGECSQWSANGQKAGYTAQPYPHPMRSALP